MYELKEEDKRSFPEFDNTEITFTFGNRSNSTTMMTKVINCDYHIGVTIVNASDPNDYFLCAHGPLSPIYKGRDRSSVDSEIWDTRFALILEAIKNKHFDCEQYLSNDLIGKSGNQPSSRTCPFNQ